MTDNDPAVEKRYVVLDQRGDVYGVPCDQTIAKSRLAHWNNDPETGVHLTAYRLVPCDADGNPTPEGARALFPELAEAVDRHSAAVAVLQAAGLGMRDNIAAVTDEATRVFTAPDRQENPELDSGSQG